MQPDKAELEHALREAVGVHAAIEVDRNQLVVTGMVRTEGEHRAAIEVLHNLAPDTDLVDNLVVEDVLPESIGDMTLSEADVGGFPGAEPATSDEERLEPGDFTDQETLSDPTSSAGPSGTHPEDELDEGDRVYVPPVDPVRDEQGGFLGGFQETALDDNLSPHGEVLPGAPDEALVEAVVEELHQDSATAGLEIEVTCEEGVVTLRGTVADLDDAINAEAVAARVPGVVEVIDELEVAAG